MFHSKTEASGHLLAQILWCAWSARADRETARWHSIEASRQKVTSRLSIGLASDREQMRRGWTETFSNECLDIWKHYALLSAEPCVMKNCCRQCAPLSDTKLKSFNGHIKSNFVAESERVNNAFFRSINLYFHTVDGDMLNALCK